MIKKLTQENKNEVLNLLQQDTILNCYLIGDVENTGLNDPSVTFFGEFFENELHTVFTIYRRYATIYSQSFGVNQDIIKVIALSHVSYISGDEMTISRYCDCFTNKGYRSMTLAILESNIVEQPKFDYRILSTYKEMEDLYDLLVTFEEFNVKDQTKENFVSEKLELNKFGTTYAIYNEGEIIATASTISETSTNAVINGVATREDHRFKGLASRLIDQIIYDYNVVKEKVLILYYDNPEAASIYKRKGFMDYGRWSSIKIDPDYIKQD